MRKALVFKTDWNHKKAGDIERVLEEGENPTTFLLSQGICELVDVEEGADMRALRFWNHPEIPDSWIKDGETVYEEPLLDGEFDTSWEYVPGRSAYKIVETDPEVVKNLNLIILRSRRNLLLDQADKEINKLLDNNGSEVLIQQWRTYRQELRDVTEYYKDPEGGWKEDLAYLNPSEVELPTPPEN